MAERDVSILTGLPGQNGTNGSVIYTGVGAPVAPTPGINIPTGSQYLDTTTPYNLYELASNNTWQLIGQLQGVDGSDGTDGTGYAATSTTSLTISDSAAISFFTQANLAYLVGTRIRLATDSTNWMEGVVTVVAPLSPTTTGIDVQLDLSEGAGTYTAWNLSVAGEQGAQGTAATNLIPANNAWTGTNIFSKLLSFTQGGDVDINAAGSGTVTLGDGNVFAITNTTNVATLTNIALTAGALATGQSPPIILYIKSVGTMTGGIKLVNNGSGTGNISIENPALTTENDIYVTVGDTLLFVPLTDGSTKKYRLVNVWTKSAWASPSYSGTYQTGTPAFRSRREGSVLRLSGQIGNSAAGVVNSDEPMATLPYASFYPARNTVIMGFSEVDGLPAAIEVKTDGTIHLRGDLTNLTDNSKLDINLTVEIA